MTLKFNKRLSITPVEEGGGSGGEVLTVTNATGQNISAGDKVWLNYLEVPETFDDDLKRISSSFVQVYDHNNTLYCYNTGTIEKIEYENSFNYDTIQTGITDFHGFTPTYVDGVTTLRNTYTGMDTSNTTCMIVSGNTGTAYTITNSLYVGDNKIVKAGNGFSIVEYNPVTGVEGATLGTSSIQANRSFTTVYMENGLLVGYRYGDWYANNTRYVDFHDVSDLSNITYISSFQLDNESKLTSITGLQTGDIFFVSVGNTEYSAVSTTRSCIIKAYRLKADKTFEACTDLPSTLQSLIGTGAYMVFNAKTNILSVGTNENIYFFEFNQHTKTFSQISFDIVMPTDETIYANYNYIPTISEDFTMLSISWNYGEYGNQICTKYYKLSYNEGWYAQPFSNVNENSLTGTAKDDIAINGSGDVAVGGYINNQDMSITANGTYTADTGYTGLGTVDVNVTPRLLAVNITPSTSLQTSTPPQNYDGYYRVTVPAVTSSIDNNITAGNIKSGVSILGVTGTYSGAGVSVESVIGQTCATVYADLTIEDYEGMQQPVVNCSIDDSSSDIMYKITGKHFQQNRYDSTQGGTWTSDDGELTLTVDWGSINPTVHVDEYGNTVATYPSIFAFYGYYENWGTGESEHMIILSSNNSRGSGIMFGEGELYFNGYGSGTE